MFIVVKNGSDYRFSGHSVEWFYKSYSSYRTDAVEPILKGEAFNLHTKSTCPWIIVDSENKDIHLDVSNVYSSIKSNPRNMVTIFDLHKWRESGERWRNVRKKEFLTRFTIPTKEYTVEDFELIDKYLLAVGKMLELVYLQSKKFSVPNFRSSSNQARSDYNMTRTWSTPTENGLPAVLSIVHSLLWDVYFAPLLEGKKEINRRNSSVSRHYLYYSSINFDYGREPSGFFKPLLDVYLDTLYRALSSSYNLDTACNIIKCSDVIEYNSYLINYYKGVYNILEMLYNTFYKGTELANIIESVRGINSDNIDDYLVRIYASMWDSDNYKHITKANAASKRSVNDYYDVLKYYGHSHNTYNRLIPKTVSKEDVKKILWDDVKARDWAWFLYMGSLLFDDITNACKISSTRIKFKVKEVKDEPKEED